MSDIRTKYTIGNIGVGLGVVSLGVATYLLLSDRSAPRHDATTLRVDVRGVKGAALASLSGRF